MPEEAMSFRDRKRAELSGERETREVDTRQVDDPSQRAPIPEAESADDEQDSSAEFIAGDEESEEEAVEASDLEDEAPEGEETEESEEDTTDWKKRYEDAELKIRELSDNRSNIEKDLADQEAETLKVRFELQDQMEEVKNRAAFMLQTMTGNAQQYRNINWAQVPPERVQELQAQAQNAFMLEQQAQQAYESTQTELKAHNEKMKQREAEVAKMRLRRTIPDWGTDKYTQLRDFAAERGLDQTVFNELTSAPLIEMINDSYNLHNASQSVEKAVSKRKQSRPQRRNAKRKPQDTRGKLAKAKADFQQNPGQRGRFADVKLQELQMERKGR